MVGRKLLEEVIIRRANALPACREAAFHPVAAAGHMGTDEPVPDAPFGGSGFKQGREAPFMAGQAVGTREAIAGPGMRRPDTTVGVPFGQPFEKSAEAYVGCPGQAAGISCVRQGMACTLFSLQRQKTAPVSALPGTSAPGGMAYTMFHRDCRYAMSCVMVCS